MRICKMVIWTERNKIIRVVITNVAVYVVKLWTWSATNCAQMIEFREHLISDAFRNRGSFFHG